MIDASPQHTLRTGYIMRTVIVFLLGLVLNVFATTLYAADCSDPSRVLGVSRTIVIDTSGGPKFGKVQYPNTLNLRKGEVVLTFDDGPHPQRTKQILQALAKHCTKATFFPVGRMMRAYPDTIKMVADAGHTIGAHSYSHPNLKRKSFKRAQFEIEKSFEIALNKTGGPVAPFFRFPGLADSPQLRKYLSSRDIAMFSVDVISGDTRYFNSRDIVKNTMSQLRRRGGGLVLFHDLKKATARALPTLLQQMHKEGFKVVHIVPSRYMSRTALAVPEGKFDEKTSSRRKKRKKYTRSKSKKSVVKRHTFPSPFVASIK